MTSVGVMAFIWIEIPSDAEISISRELSEKSEFDVVTNIACVSILHDASVFLEFFRVVPLTS
ncbi:hypothetical protein [Brucella sp. NBRC 12950]|uniref:hypothetical protein n=1 Tax=Brucella sp. NBRC 12950 TaxID=2994518 RepID=UPI0024A089A1|nr:hypothetical protein [Brucella sp. NBRC 12950]GLU28002.1 hypothetical protein Brsp01_32350 [Brucella sp. NBRC 12950]